RSNFTPRMGQVHTGHVICEGSPMATTTMCQANGPFRKDFDHDKQNASDTTRRTKQQRSDRQIKRGIKRQIGEA
ncbi:MAG: hypothetical protein WA728_31205, partial [Xanthobacteraceae bacterium]